MKTFERKTLDSIIQELQGQGYNDIAAHVAAVKALEDYAHEMWREAMSARTECVRLDSKVKHLEKELAEYQTKVDDSKDVDKKPEVFQGDLTEALAHLAISTHNSFVWEKVPRLIQEKVFEDWMNLGPVPAEIVLSHIRMMRHGHV